MAAKLLEPIPPGEVLYEEFMKPLGVSINALAREIAVPPNRVSGIVNVYEVAQLRTIAKDLNLLVLERETYEPGEEALPVVLDQLTGAVHVGQAERTGAHAEDVVVHQVIVLACRLVDAVDIGRLD